MHLRVFSRHHISNKTYGLKIESLEFAAGWVADCREGALYIDALAHNLPAVSAALLTGGQAPSLQVVSDLSLICE